MDHSAVQESGDSLPTVLYVDDEPLAQKYFKASIGHRAKVLTANNPVEAWAVLAEYGRPVSVVVSDERMPLQCGVPFLQAMAKKSPATIRVLTSAYADVDKLQQAINDAAIHRFVPKPWDLDHLCQVVCEALITQWDADDVVSPTLKDASDDASMRMTVLVGRLVTPLREMEADAAMLVGLTASKSVSINSGHHAQLDKWAAHRSLGQFAVIAARQHQHAVECLSAAEAIAGMTDKPGRLQ